MTALPSTEDLARLAKENYDDPQYLAALGLMIVTGRTATSLVQRGFEFDQLDIRITCLYQQLDTCHVICETNFDLTFETTYTCDFEHFVFLESC